MIKPNVLPTSALRYALLLSVLHAPLVTAEQLTVLTWTDYISEQAVAMFEQETGHSVKMVLYDSDDQRDEIMASTEGQGFDVVVIDSLSSRILAEGQLLSPTPELESTIQEAIAPRWQTSCNGYGVPYFWGTLGIVYRTDRVDPPPTSWQDLLQPAPSMIGHIGMHLDQNDTFIPALKILGLSINSGQKSDLKQAYDLLMKQRPTVLSYQYVLTYEQLHPDDDLLYMAMAYSGDQYILNELSGDERWQFVIPDEGTSLWIDCLSISQASAQKALASEFIRFMNRQDIAAINANDIGSATTNRLALPLIEQELLDDPTIYPPQAQLDKSEFYETLSDETFSLRNRIIGTLRNQQP